MDTLKEYLDGLLSEQENVEVEFKHAHGGFPGSFWETYSAFANTNGGIIIFGVKEKHDQFFLDPIDDALAETLIKTFWKQVRSKDCVNLCLLSNDDISKSKYDYKNIIIFNVPRSPIADRPVYVGRDPLTGTYRRGHEGDYKCTPSEVRQMFADANIDAPADSRLLEFFGMDDIDIDSLNQYRQRMAVANPDHVWLGLDNKEFLKKLGGYRVDRRTKKEGLTVAGLLMFGKWSSIRDVEAIPNYGVDYREYTETSERWSHRIFSDGSWEANLFQFFYRVLPRLQSVIDTPFRLQGNTRIDQKPAHKSLREALVNCLIHAAYGSTTRVVISRYPYEIVFSNPGTMLVSQRQFFTGGQSVCRNQSLQVMFSLLGAGDQAGSGGDVILHGWKDENFRIPFIEETERPDKVELTLPLESVMSDNVKSKLIKYFGEDVLNIDHTSLMILALAASEDVTNEKLQYTIDAHSSDISKMLKTLCKNGNLVASGIGRGTHYKLNEAYASTHTNAKLNAPVDATPNAKVKDKPTDDKSKVSNLADSDVTLALDTESKPKDKVKSKAESKPNGNKCLIFNELKMFCKVWRKSTDMARHIGKTPNYLSRKIIPEMIERGLLIREYPDNPHHPAQRYRTKPRATASE